ncbi:MAG TPA: hypothetical protein VK563_15190 [Puia sp.]|nr:hypothetical protein [Puia sp.]
MNLYCAVTLFLCLSALYTDAQDVPLRYFDIKSPSHKKSLPAYNKVSNSRYKKIGFLDCRDDTTYIGTVNVGVLRHEGKLKLRMPFQPQLQALMDSLTDSSVGNGELLFQLRDFHFVEKMDTRYCYLQVGLYVKMEDQYRRLSILDTVMIVTSSDVTGVVQTLGSRIMTDFLVYELSREPEHSAAFQIQEVLQYDSIEKSRIPLFTSTQYVNGIYDDYYSFSRQQPDRQGQIKADKNGVISRVAAQDSTGRLVKLKSKNLYALVYDGKPYIATEYGYYRVEKVNNNLFFTGKVKVAASAGDKNGAAMAFGLIGAAMASGGYAATYEMIIDPVSGVFVHLRKIETPEQGL